MEVSPQEEMANPEGMKVFAVERPGLSEDFVSFSALCGVQSSPIVATLCGVQSSNTALVQFVKILLTHVTEIKTQFLVFRRIELTTSSVLLIVDPTTRATSTEYNIYYM